MKPPRERRNKLNSSPRFPMGIRSISRPWFTLCFNWRIEIQFRVWAIAAAMSSFQTESGGDMRILKTVLVVLALGALPLHAADQQSGGALNQVVDRIVSQEQAEMNSLKPF